jgi:RNA polymerase sigma-70 factor (ECF subfamily)
VAIVESNGNQFGPEERATFDEVRQQMEAAVARLPLRQRLAFTLRKLHDLDYVVIGKMLDCSLETARANVFQAFRKIRQMMNELESNRKEVRPWR